MIWTIKIVQLSIVRKRLVRNGVLTKRSWQIKISRARVTVPSPKACRTSFNIWRRAALLSGPVRQAHWEAGKRSLASQEAES